MNVSSAERPVRRSAYLLAELAQQLTLMLKDFKADNPPFYFKYLLYFLIYAKRQIEAICILLAHESHPIYAEQAGQLVRVLIELTIKLAWMVNPDEASQRDYRALQMEKDSVKKEQLSDAQKDEIYKRSGILRYECQTKRSITRPPKVYQMATEIDSDIYILYRWESSRVHLSLLTLSNTIEFTQEQDGSYKVYADAPDHESVSATILFQTLILLDQVAKTTLPQLDLNTTAWTASIRNVQQEIGLLLTPLINESILPAATQKDL